MGDFRGPPITPRLEHSAAFPVQHKDYPASCACGHGALGAPTPYHTHQVIELPLSMCILPIACRTKPLVPAMARYAKPQCQPHGTGYGPRLTALIGALAAMHRSSRRLVQDFWSSVLHIPVSLRAVPKMMDRASQAIVPHDEAIATLAHHAPVGYIDATPWSCRHTLQ